MVVYSGSPEFVDLVQIRCPAEEDVPTGFGSGLLVGHGIVLTALHCVTIKDRGWRARNEIKVYLHRDLRGNVVKSYAASRVWPEAVQPNPSDVAVLVIEGEDAPRPQGQVGFSERPAGGFPVEARGFPNIAEGDEHLGGRGELNLAGNAFYATDSPPTLMFTPGSEPEGAGTPVWGGLSGGPMIYSGAVIGVMRDVPERWDGRKTLTAEPLPRLLHRDGDAELRRRLGITGELAQAGGAGPNQDFQRLWEYVYTLDRRDEVAQALNAIRPHARDRPVELLVRGDPEDLCEEFFHRLWRGQLGPRPRRDVAGGISAVQPPAAIRWPKCDGELSTAAGELADEAAARLSDDILWGMDFESLRALLSARPQAPWLCLQMPGVLGPLDLALLEKWRAAWAGLARADRQPLGYFLLQPLAAPVPAGLTLANAEQLRRGLGQASVALRPIELDEFDGWVQELRALEQERPAAPGNPPLSLIAFQVAGRVKQAFAADPRLQLRLEAVRRLLAGEPAWYRTAA